MGLSEDGAALDRDRRDAASVVKRRLERTIMVDFKENRLKNVKIRRDRFLNREVLSAAVDL